MTLDITNNTQLIELNIASNNIQDIDLSNNTLLEEARLNFNQLSTIDLSHNTLLQKTFLNSNQLTSVNLKNGNNEIINTFNAIGNSSLTCILVDNAVDFTADWENFIDAQTSFNDVSCTVQISPKIFLQGAALNPNTDEENLMRDDLRVAGLIPTLSPYGDGATCAPTVFDVTGNDAIVDWVFIELRDATDNTTILASTPALVQRDGDVVALDGISVVSINSTTDDYYVALKHRNHLGVLTASAISLSEMTTTLDLSTDITSVTGGALALKDMGNSIYAMYAGDAVSDGSVLNTDISNALAASGGIAVYTGADADMDGNILNTDVALIIQPNAGRIQQF
jgi:hypothetical protein